MYTKPIFSCIEVISYVCAYGHFPYEKLSFSSADFDEKLNLVPSVLSEAGKSDVFLFHEKFYIIFYNLIMNEK